MFFPHLRDESQFGATGLKTPESFDRSYYLDGELLMTFYGETQTVYLYGAPGTCQDHRRSDHHRYDGNGRYAAAVLLSLLLEATTHPSQTVGQLMADLRDLIAADNPKNIEREQEVAFGPVKPCCPTDGSNGQPVTSD